MSVEQSPESAYVRFYRNWRAFSHTKDDDDQLVFCVYPGGKGSDFGYEFTAVDVGSGPRYRERIAVKMGLFSDSWQAFRDLPEFFAALAERHDSGATLDDLTEIALNLGWEDITAEYESRHVHSFRCDCGERGVAYRPAKPTPPTAGASS